MTPCALPFWKELRSPVRSGVCSYCCCGEVLPSALPCAGFVGPRPATCRRVRRRACDVKSSFTNHSPQMLLARVEPRKLLMKMRDLGGIVVNDVGIVGMICGIVLVVSLSRIKGLQRNDLSNDRMGKNPGLLELRDVSVSNSLLFVAIVE